MPGVNSQTAQPGSHSVRALASGERRTIGKKRGRCLAAERPVSTLFSLTPVRCCGGLSVCAFGQLYLAQLLRFRHCQPDTPLGASRVQFNLTLIPDLFSPQKLTQSVPQVYGRSTCNNLQPSFHLALLPGRSAPHGASCDETILLCRADGYQMNSQQHGPPVKSAI